MTPGDPITAIYDKIADQAAPPSHVAIIMDGNGRWAKAHNLPRAAGHQRGAQAVKTAIKAAIEAGVSYLTLYGFSSENWKRPQDEVEDLMGLLRLYLKSEIKTLHKQGVRVLIIGNRQRLDGDIIRLIDQAEALTTDNRRLTVTIALSYGGRDELTQVARILAEKAASGEISPDDIDEEMFGRYLYTAGTPDPDILIRTSGEQRISNFLPWQLAYTEFVFLDLLWPDFTKQDFDAAISDYLGRDRRYGATSG